MANWRLIVPSGEAAPGPVGLPRLLSQKGYQLWRWSPVGNGFGSEAIKQLMADHPGKLYANISPRNPSSVKFFKQFGAKHIQNTYVLGS